MAVLLETAPYTARTTNAVRGVPRLVFANQLRGLAALSVVISHLIGVYWAGRELVAAATATPVTTGGTSRLFELVAYPWFNFGPFGVAIFFLISGLVIPISLEQHTKTTFLLARLLRIYPTFMVALSLSLLVVWINSKLWNLPFPAGKHTVVINFLLLQNLLGEADLTLVSWTLAIEVKFYIIMMLARPAVLSGNVSTLFLIGFVVLAGNLAATSPVLAPWLATVPSVEGDSLLSSSGVVFMLIGVIFNYRMRKLISLSAFLSSTMAMTALFLAVWRTSAFADQFPNITADYLYAIFLFGALYALRHHLPRIAVLDALAAVSFPLYLVHSLIGYSSLKALTLGAGLGYRAALPLTLLIVIGIAAALHVSVERWTIRLGKRLSVHGSKAVGRGTSAHPM